MFLCRFNCVVVAARVSFSIHFKQTNADSFGKVCVSLLCLISDRYTNVESDNIIVKSVYSDSLI